MVEPLTVYNPSSLPDGFSHILDVLAISLAIDAEAIAHRLTYGEQHRKCHHGIFI